MDNQKEKTGKSTCLFFLFCRSMGLALTTFVIYANAFAVESDSFNISK
jgi:hypothetical protein